MLNNTAIERRAPDILLLVGGVMVPQWQELSEDGGRRTLQRARTLKWQPINQIQ